MVESKEPEFFSKQVAEARQSFDDFVRHKPNRPDKIRSKIYLQPVGEFPKGQIPLLEMLREYTATCFAMGVEVLPP